MNFKTIFPLLARSEITIWICTDFMLAVLAYYAAFALRLGDPWITKYHDFFISSLAPVVLCQVSLFWAAGVYKHFVRYANLSVALSLVKIISVAVLASLAISFILVSRNFPRSIFIINWLFLSVFIMGSRFIQRIVREESLRIQKKRSSVKTLIYGAGGASHRLIQAIFNESDLNYNVAGLIDDDPEKFRKRIGNLQVIGSGDDLEEIVRIYNIECIIIAIPSLSGEGLMRILSKIKRTKIIPQITPSIHELFEKKQSITQLKDVKIEDVLKRSPKSLNFSVIKDFIQNRIVLISGAGGSIGKELVFQVASHNPQMILMVDDCEFNLFEIHNHVIEKFPHIRVVPLLLNICYEYALEKVFERHQPHYILHAAAYKHVPMVESNPSAGIYNNIKGTYNLALMAQKYCASKFVLISSDKAVRPTNIMGATKKLCELFIQNLPHNGVTEFISVRFGNVIGSSGSVIPQMLEQINNGKSVTVTHRHITRYFMLISEAVSLTLQAATIGKNGDILVLDMGKPINIYEMAENLIYLCGKIPHQEVKIRLTGLRPGEKLFEELWSYGVETQTKYNDIFLASSGEKMDFNFLTMRMEQLIDASYRHQDERCLSLLKELIQIYRNEDFMDFAATQPAVALNIC